MRVLVVSHPCVLPVNQTVYRNLRQRGWDISVVVPNRWRHAYSEGEFRAEPLEGLESAFESRPVRFAGAPQRHVYRLRPSRVLRHHQPDVVFLEQEPFSVSAFQWGRAASRLNIPFGVQAAANLDRPLPLPARRMRDCTLPRARFVAARSPGAARLVQSWGAEGVVGLAPHAVPHWLERAWPPLPVRSSRSAMPAGSFAKKELTFCSGRFAGCPRRFGCWSAATVPSPARSKLRRHGVCRSRS